KIDGAKLRAIDGNRGAGCKSDFHLLRLVRSFFRRNHPLPHGLARRIGGIFELSALVAEVPDVAVAAVDVFLALLDRHLVLLRVSDGILARLNVPLPPGRDDLDMRCDGFIRSEERRVGKEGSCW